MGTELLDLFPDLVQKETNETNNLRNGLNRYFYHWPLFLLGIVLSITIAYFYIQISDPAAEIKATVIIKDDKKESIDNKEKLQEIELSSPSKLAENEIEVFKSRTLIYRVVDSLKLQINYKIKNRFVSNDLYSNTPVRILLDSTNNVDGRILHIKLLNERSFILTSEDGPPRELFFNKRIQSDFGDWILSPTRNFAKFKGKQIEITLSNRDRTAQKYQKLLNVELPNKLAPIIQLTVKDKIEERGKDIINAVIEIYNELSRSEKNQLTQKTLQFIDKRIELLADELNNSEKNVESFRSQNNITDISSQSQVYLENVQSNDSKLNEVTLQLKVIEEIQKEYNSSQDIKNATAALGGSFPSLNNLIEKLSLLQLDHDRMLGNTPEGNPAFEPLNRQIAATKSDIKSTIDNIKLSLLAQLKKLNANGTLYKSSIQQVPVRERQLVDKMRQQTIDQNLYVYLLQKREEIALNYAAVMPDARIVDYAYSSQNPTGVYATYLIALFFGLLAPATLIFTRNSFNNRVTDRREVEENTGLSILGEISYANVNTPLVTMQEENIMVTEEFKSLRTNIRLLNTPHEKGLVILLTSSISKEGKTFITGNLGSVLAKPENKVIIIDLDLRRPKLTKMFNIQTSVLGISNYLIGDVKIEEIIQPSGVIENLDILPAGTVHSDPTLLLEKPEMDFLIGWLRSKYDYILIDTPPIQLVTDAKILAKYSDLILFVVRQAYTFKSLLPSIRTITKEEQLTTPHIIFNSVIKEKYGYGYDYANEYYDAIAGRRSHKINELFHSFFRRF